jgi:putative lysine transport system permease protein
MTFFDWILKLITEYWTLFLKGAGYTVIMALVGTVAGFLIGLLIAIVRTVPIQPSDKAWKKGFFKVVNAILSAYVEIIRGTPMLVQALIIHYSVFAQMGMHPLLSAIIIISVNTGAYMAEIVRGGIISIDKGQFEGAEAIGLRHFQTMFYVVLPQAVRNIMPSIGNEFVVNIKDSSVLSVISITELMFMAKSAGGTYMQFVPAYVICAVIYFILTFTVTRILRLIEKKMDGADSYVICGSQSDYKSMIKVGGKNDADS